MKSFDLSLPTPAENLACDEALLDAGDDGGGAMLRFWNPQEVFVVVGYANEVATEVNQAACVADAVPILRRCSGGGTVLQGPGCLNYSLVLPIEHGPLQNITGANRFIMERHRDALAAALGRPVEVEGHTDLALGGRKFSGNAQRRKRRCLLFHGCFLLNLDLGLVERYLLMPTNEPDYRGRRSHADFLTNLDATAESVKAALRSAWQASDAPVAVPLERIAALVREKYATREWNFRF